MTDAVRAKLREVLKTRLMSWSRLRESMIDEAIDGAFYDLEVDQAVYPEHYGHGK